MDAFPRQYRLRPKHPMWAYGIILLMALMAGSCSVHRLRKQLRRNGETVIVTVYDSKLMSEKTVDSLTEVNVVPDFDAGAFGRFIALHGHHHLPACDDGGEVTVQNADGTTKVVRFSLKERCVSFKITRRNGNTVLVKKRLKKRAAQKLAAITRGATTSSDEPRVPAD